MLDGVQIPLGKGQFWGKWAPIVKCRDTLRSPVWKQLNRLNLLFGLWTRVGRRKHKFNCILQVAPMCPPMWTVRLQWWCSINVKLLWPLVICAATLPYLLYPMWCLLWDLSDNGESPNDVSHCLWLFEDHTWWLTLHQGLGLGLEAKVLAWDQDLIQWVFDCDLLLLLKVLNVNLILICRTRCQGPGLGLRLRLESF